MNTHPNLALFNTLTVQLTNIQNGFSSFEVFKDELKSILNKLIDGHNTVRQELFLMRNIQKDDAKEMREVKDAIKSIPKRPNVQFEEPSSKGQTKGQTKTNLKSDNKANSAVPQPKVSKPDNRVNSAVPQPKV